MNEGIGVRRTALNMEVDPASTGRISTVRLAERGRVAVGGVRLKDENNSRSRLIKTPASQQKFDPSPVEVSSQIQGQLEGQRMPHDIVGIRRLNVRQRSTLINVG